MITRLVKETRGEGGVARWGDKDNIWKGKGEGVTNILGSL